MNSKKRVVRVQAPGGFVRGTMEAQVGMVTEDGWIISRVNDKSVVVSDPTGVCSPWRRTDTQSVSVGEARKHGWPANAVTVAPKTDR